MALLSSKSVRFPSYLELDNSSSSQGSVLNLTGEANENQVLPLSISKKMENKATNTPPKKKKLLRVFSEDYELVKHKILDPRGPFISSWNKIFMLACLVSLFIDPLFLYLPVTKDVCIDICTSLETAITIIRTVVDVFYIINIFIRFRTAYVAPSSRIFGRGELIVDPSKIARRYLRGGFWLDFVAAQPIPQALVLLIIPSLRGPDAINMKTTSRLVVISQFVLRLYLIFPLSSQIINTAGVIMKTAWAGAAYNLMLYMLASHVVGAGWYLLSLDRQEECWKRVCLSLGDINCKYAFFDCHTMGAFGRKEWLKSSNISTLCNPNSDFFQFGIYADFITFDIGSSRFFDKYFYCLWWGLRNLSCLGTNLMTSTYVGEIFLALLIAILGLVLFALLIGNLQTYLQSTAVRREEHRIKMADTEKWMHHRQLPHELRQNVRRYDRYRWITTRGVDEEAILKGLPVDLRRDIKRHLCLDLVRRVPLFDQMEDIMLDAICERLRPVLFTQGTCIVREGDPVIEMLFIIRGYLDSSTTNGGQTGFFNSGRIGPTDFCGEELLTWSLDPGQGNSLPHSTRTVKALTEVEAFALIAEDLKFVASQFRRLHSKQLRHTLRFHSYQWRTWAACFIQAAWFRYKRRKEAAELKAKEILNTSGSPTERSPQVGHPETSLATYVGMLAPGSRRSGSRHAGVEFEILGTLQKPVEPDF